MRSIRIDIPSMDDMFLLVGIIATSVGLSTGSAMVVIAGIACITVGYISDPRL